MQGRKIKNYISLLFMLLLLFCSYNNYLNVFAQNNKIICANFTCDDSNFSQGDNLALNFKLNPNFNGDIQAFIIDLYYNSADLSFKGVSKFVSIDSADISYYASGDKIKILYVASNNGFEVNANNEISVIGLNFKINQDAIGDYSIKTNVEEIIDDNNEILNVENAENNFNFSISQFQKTDARLKAMTSNVGKLEPDFDSDITQYYLEVDENTKQVVISATPMDDKTTVKVNRKNLFKAGTQTPIYVTTKNSSTTMQYTITVNRLENDSGSNAKSTSKATNSNKSNKGISSKINKNNADGISSNNGSNFLNNSFFVKQSKYLPFMVITLILLLAFICALFIWENKKKSNLKKGDKNNGRNKL